ncbi:UNVERIFIED_CONTAM: hypothetical protein PYX00_000809 [Menopon gallinae]|uniref:cAMP-regulated phosphoprotein 19 n=1 Tax=Menopon gallinae TaxID=328185 RepID=A0AAW2IBR8_9NEOP
MSELEGTNEAEISTVKTEQMSSKDVERLEEAKLKAKFPMAANKPLSGHSAFLQKRLAKGQKFFDSGDYNMARQKQAPRNAPAAIPVYGTGETIPTPETVPVRKTSIIQPKFPSSAT